MLKITYLENDICLEHLSKSIKVWKSEISQLNARMTVEVFTESSTASLVFSANLPQLRQLTNIAKKQQILEIMPCEQEYIEVSLSGTWIAETEDSEIGIFVCEMSSSCEFLLAQLWQDSKIIAPVN
ncbi:MAG: alr0857 family protein [Cyanobacteria bacterium J06621_8]